MREIKKHSFYLKGKKLFEEIFVIKQVNDENKNGNDNNKENNFHRNENKEEEEINKEQKDKDNSIIEIGVKKMKVNEEQKEIDNNIISLGDELDKKELMKNINIENIKKNIKYFMQNFFY